MLIQACQINPKIGDLQRNLKKIFQALDRGRERQADVILFPEMTLTGYCPEDLLLDGTLAQRAEEALQEILPLTKGRMVIVGLPRKNSRRHEKPFYNSAAVMVDGELVGFKDKTLLPTYDVFDDRRYFEPGDQEPVFEFLGRKIGITICEDAWQHAGLVQWSDYNKDPILNLADQGVDLMLNLSASPYSYRRLVTRLAVFEAAAKTLRCPVIVCNQVGGNDGLLFDGHSFYVNEKGEMLQLARGFEEEDLWVDLGGHVCKCLLPEDEIKDLFAALVMGVRDYFEKQGFKKAILGLSGGIDSALVAVIAKEALGKDNVRAFFLPSRFTLSQSHQDAAKLAENLGIGFEVIEIEPLFQTYLDQLGQRFEGRGWDLTEENLQARIRSNLLMAIVNKEGGILLNTSNKSEMAMGYSTLYGDLSGGLAVLSDVLKTRVYELSRYVNREREIIPQSIIERAPTAELRENQKDEDTLPPYAILDPIVEGLVEQVLTPEQVSQETGISLELVQGIRRKIHLAEYKRRQAPVGLRVTQKAFTKGRFVPIVSCWG